MEIIVPAAVIAAIMLGFWLLSLLVSDTSVVDPVWGPAFGCVAVAVALTRHRPGTGVWVVMGMTVLWGARLGGYLAARKLAEPGEDRRYRRMRERHPTGFWLYSLGAVFLTQGLMVGLVALPIEFLPSTHGGWQVQHAVAGIGYVAHPRSLTWLVIPGIALWALGMFFEAVGDEQLRRFKADPDSRGKVMNRGLWRYTRHPNHFGDACAWWGIWLTAVAAGTPWWTVIAPLWMNFLLARGSGKPTVERDIAERRPGYAEYLETTSGFIPLPPRRRAGAAGSD